MSSGFNTQAFIILIGQCVVITYIYRVFHSFRTEKKNVRFGRYDSFVHAIGMTSLLRESIVFV